CWWTELIASARSAPTTSGRTFRLRATSASTCGSRSWTTSTRSRSPRRWRLLDEASAHDRGPRARRHRADHGSGGGVRGGRPTRHKEGADPPRSHYRQPLLRVEHAHELVLRTGGE